MNDVPESIFVDAEGVRLHAVVEGPASAPPVLLLHGFTGSAESMEGVSQPLVSTHRVVRLELVGHGESDAPEEVAPYAMDACASQVVAATKALGLDRPHLVGYSMGGRTALSTVVQAPSAFRSVTLVGATAGLAGADERAARIAADEALADRIERDGLEAFVDHWMALPIFASQSKLGDAFLSLARAERMRQRPRGLANSLRGMGAGAQAPIWDRLDRCAPPVLLVVGELDAKFRALAERLEGALPDARTAIVSGVGHAAHLEDADAFGDLLRAFVEVVDDDEEGEGEGS